MAINEFANKILEGIDGYQNYLQNIINSDEMKKKESELTDNQRDLLNTATSPVDISGSSLDDKLNELTKILRKNGV